MNKIGLFLRDRRRLANSRLHLDPGAGRISGLEWTGEQMLGAAYRHTDEKKWHVVCARPLIEDQRDELVYHRVRRHKTFDRSGHIKSQRSSMLYASRLGQSPFNPVTRAAAMAALAKSYRRK